MVFETHATNSQVATIRLLSTKLSHCSADETWIGGDTFYSHSARSSFRVINSATACLHVSDCSWTTSENVRLFLLVFSFPNSRNQLRENFSTFPVLRPMLQRTIETGEENSFPDKHRMKDTRHFMSYFWHILWHEVIFAYYAVKGCTRCHIFVEIWQIWELYSAFWRIFTIDSIRRENWLKPDKRENRLREFFPIPLHSRLSGFDYTYERALMLFVIVRVRSQPWRVSQMEGVLFRSGPIERSAESGSEDSADFGEWTGLGRSTDWAATAKTTGHRRAHSERAGEHPCARRGRAHLWAGLRQGTVWCYFLHASVSCLNQRWAPGGTCILLQNIQIV